MGLLETILIIVILVVLVIVIWNVFFKKNTMLMNGIHQASPGVEISHSIMVLYRGLELKLWKC
jgi:hypothetical protein